MCNVIVGPNFLNGKGIWRGAIAAQKATVYALILSIHLKYYHLQRLGKGQDEGRRWDGGEGVSPLWMLIRGKTVYAL